MSTSKNTTDNKQKKHDLHYKSATELLAMLASKQISSVELLEASISRIEKLDKHINAVVIRDFERARLAAKAADIAIARGERRPLHGLPITVKECLNIAGLPTSWGDIKYKDWQPSSDALAITRLKTAGAIILGKTNVPLMLSDWQSYNEIYGTTNNPWDLSLTPGGSSGGSAAALAAGFVSLELGTDIAGSLRTPAHFCGVYAHKPSIDLVPLRGASPPTTQELPTRHDLPVIGPMARSAIDLDLALNILAGPDDLSDGIGYKLALPPARHNDLRNFRVLVLDTHPLCPTASTVSRSIDHLIERLIKCGVAVSRDHQRVPDLAKIARIYYSLLKSFNAAGMPIESYQMLVKEAQVLSADDASLTACGLRGTVSNHREWLMTMRIREQLRQQWRNLGTEFDVVLCPVMPALAFPHDHSPIDKRQMKVDNAQLPYIDQLVWISIATLLGLPATVVPIDAYETGLPIGMQIIGHYLEDRTTIAFARMIEREFGGFVPPPIDHVSYNYGSKSK